MTFFNRKEEVTDLKLTPYGRHELSRGNFKPEFYAFYDDDVLYDGDWGGLTGENQNHIEPRIKETPRIRVQPTRTSVTARAVGEDCDLDGWCATSPYISPTQNTIDRNFALINPLGSSGYNTEYLPSWNLNFHKGIISGSQAYTEISGAHDPTPGAHRWPSRIVDANHPQIDCLAIYETKSPLFATADMIDENQVIIKEDFILIGLEEKNTNFSVKNFEFEIFQVEKKLNEDGYDTGEEDLTPLRFNNTFFDADLSQNEVVGDTTSTLSTNVEYYFNIAVDENIGRDILCKHVVDKSQGVFSDGLIECGETQEDLSMYDIYQDMDEDPGDTC